MRVAILMPTKGRAEQMKARVNDLLSQPLPADVELVVVLAICRYDGESWQAAHDLVGMWYESEHTLVLVKRAAESTAVEGWNLAYEAVREVCDWFVLGADDIVWHSGWLAAALALIRETGARCIGLNDGHTDLAQYGPHYMVHRSFTEEILGGCMVPPVYKSWWFDREICEIAQQRGLYAPGWGVHVEHLHPDWHTAQRDATYDEAWELHDVDKVTYLERRRDGFHAKAQRREGEKV